MKIIYSPRDKWALRNENGQFLTPYFYKRYSGDLSIAKLFDDKEIAKRVRQTEGQDLEIVPVKETREVIEN